MAKSLPKIYLMEPVNYLTSGVIKSPVYTLVNLSCSLTLILSKNYNNYKGEYYE
jgi:hypothetical protein